MKILAPVSSVSEAESLIERGAAEFYCGLLPRVWKRKYGNQLWLSRRGEKGSNFKSFPALKKMVEIAHQGNVPVFLTLNQQFYLPEQYQEVVGLAGKAREYCGIDAVIVGDPGLIIALKEAFPNLTIHVSSLAAVLNSASAAFFQSLGVERIIFPRYLSLEDLRLIMEKIGPIVEYEVFILNDGCIFEEGYCFANHIFGGAFCHNPSWQYQLLETDSRRIYPNKESFSRHLRDYRQWVQFAIRNCHGSLSLAGFPLGMCGLCALPELKKLGVKSLKIVGRESSTAKKLASVTLVKKVLDGLEAGLDEKAIQSRAKDLRNTSDNLCATNYLCYYR